VLQDAAQINHACRSDAGHIRTAPERFGTISRPLRAVSK
jgi:hypothetical protein